MRLIDTFFDSDEVKRVASLLDRKKIETKTEVTFDPKTGKMQYDLWVLDEDAFQEAAQAIAVFKENPEHSDYDPPPPSPLSSTFLRKVSQEGKKRQTPFTFMTLFLCITLFFMGAFSPEEEQGELSPLTLSLLFDAPSERGPSWKGVYEWILLKGEGKDTASVEGPLFVKIREGEIWRLFTPCLLHLGFLHLLFNMIWLWVLGRAVEERIGTLKSILLSVGVGVISNVTQYLMSGPLFLGYSGIVVGLAGFIWMREKKAPWEGYPIHRSTFLFLFFFVLVMGALQALSFFLNLFALGSFQPGIANTAHIVGGLVGIWLGRFSYFSKLSERASS